MEVRRHLATRAPSPFSPWEKESRTSAAGRKLLCALFLSLLLLSPATSFAVEPGEMLADPKLESRARSIASELRCLVCQNQSIDDSDAPLAKDLRVIVREKLKEGASDADVRAFVVSRYGDFVLLRPPVKPETWLLWTAPLIALLGGVWAVFSALRRSRGQSAASGLTEEERAQLQAMGVSASPPRRPPAARERE